MEPLGHFAPIFEVQPDDNAVQQELLLDLQDLDLLLQQQGMPDELSGNLRAWVDHFIRLLNLGTPVDLVFERLIPRIYQLLRNPFGALWPYDTEVFLGNDGHCYSRKALAVHLTLSEDEFLQRSPFNPLDPLPFFLTGPHHTVYTVQNWLVAHGIELQQSEVDRLHNQLEAQGRLVAIPLGRPAVRPGGAEDAFERRRQRLIARQQQREVNAPLAAIESEAEAAFRRTAERMAGFFQQIQARQAELANAGQGLQNNIGEFLGQHQQVAERVHQLQENILNEGLAARQERFNLEQFQRQENMERELRLFQEALRAAIAQGDVNNAQIQQMGVRFEGYIQRMAEMGGRAREQLQYLQNEVVGIHVDHLEGQLQVIDDQNQELDPRLDNLGFGIHQARQQQAAMGEAINDLDRAIKRKEQSIWKSLGMCVLELGCYWLGSYALSSLVKGFTIAPSAKYGPMLSYQTKLGGPK